jgi:hypothetical protein
MTRSSLHVPFCVASLFLCGVASAGGLVLNEYNAVGSTKWLGNPSTTGCTGATGATCATNDDSYFGRVMGNGGNWLEFVVVTDHLDIRGWKIRWAEPGNVSASNGPDQWYGNAQVDQGIITFTNDARWSNLRKGTILTVHEFAASQPQGQAQGGKDDDFTFDPCNGDWWISVHTFGNNVLVSATTNVAGNVPGNFSVGNNNWLCQIVDATGTVVTPNCGEGATGYGGGGVSSTEICRFEATPTATTSATSAYDDGDSSTCGTQNTWRDALTLCRYFQDLEPLRADVRAELCTTCKPVILNEYNAVDSSSFLNGGTAKADADLGLASDTHFGRVQGNGGNWFELVVIEDHLDMRGWTLDWNMRTALQHGSIQLAASDALRDLRAGTIITFIEKSTKLGGLDTDLSLDFANGDRWINLNTFDASVVSGTTSNIAGAVSGEFKTSNNEWSLSMRNASGTLVVGPVGEGTDAYYEGGVSSTDVCRLKDNPGPRIDANSQYDDAKDASTFGAPNQTTVCETGATVTQDFSGLPVAGCSASTGIPGDINGDGHVNASDLAMVLGAWGGSRSGADLNHDGVVNASDLAIVLGNWTS